MIQYLIVGLIVGSALLYSVWALMPTALRRAAAGRLARFARRSGLGESGAQRLQAKLETGGACSECAQCKGCRSGRSRGPR
jgi:hypothetical protein